ncbi:hypothetical protein RBB79_17535 [Tunturiibacter empetritectus]|uniref:Transmembrane protein n=1 Tax=Tunturiibacter lichenicola TaxID=2051959 RepID=A0A852VF08_9BACT|nr:hypothetical protein [Edaphobacter lichenicola]NYF91438.1 hypothetical protein [Edaphobacter lichenicola]
MAHVGNVNLPVEDQRTGYRSVGNNEANSSGVSWSAVVAGAFVTAALSLILIALGTGLGLASVSVWSGVGASTSTIGGAAIVWLILIQIMSSSMGGYLAGRLRTKWAGIRTDEVYFRDTAHGFLAWSVALVVTAAFLTSAATSLMGAAPGSENSTAATKNQAGTASPNPYFVDSLFRTDGSKPEIDNTSVNREAGVIFATALKQGDLSAADKTYLDQLVISKTGLSQSDADKRVSDLFLSVKAAAETARKSVAHTLLWTFVALLIGAFCASFAGTIGGRQRDHVVAI